jgi:hypothetical protein
MFLYGEQETIFSGGMGSIQQPINPLTLHVSKNIREAGGGLMSLWVAATSFFQNGNSKRLNAVLKIHIRDFTRI